MGAKKRAKNVAAASGKAKAGSRASETPKDPLQPRPRCTSDGSSPHSSGLEADEKGEGSRPNPPVVGLVGSAVGLPDFKKILTTLPVDGGIAFVLGSHLDPKHESLIVESMSRHTSMPVTEAVEGMRVEANHVYVIPPNKYVTISDGVLHLNGPVEHGDLRLLETALQNFNVAILIYDFDGRITVWNRGAEQTFGYTETEALRMNAAELIPQELRKETRAVWERLRQGERVNSWEAQRVSKDGRTLDVWVSAIAVTDDSGRPAGIAALEWDTTERSHIRIQLEQEIERRTILYHERDLRLRAVLDTATDAIVTINERGFIESVNPATERMFGYSATEMIGQNVKMLMSAPFQDEHDDYLARYLQTGEKRIIGIGREVEGRRKDGSICPVDLAVSEIDNPHLFTGILRDITERKRLWHDVTTIADLEQQRIAQDLHDECGQELTALGLLADSLASPERGSAGDVEIGRKIGERTKSVLRHFRDVCSNLARTEVDPAGLPAALTELTSRLNETSDVRIVFHREKLIRVRDVLQATHLYYITQEACTNALKHADARNIEVRLRSADDVTILEIQDDGHGFRRKASNGLGLRIMRNRANVIGARLTIDSVKPRGTLVSCILRKKGSHDSRQSHLSGS